MMLASRGPAFRGPPKTTSCRARRAIQLQCNTTTALSFVHDSESFWAKLYRADFVAMIAVHYILLLMRSRILLNKVVYGT